MHFCKLQENHTVIYNGKEYPAILTVPESPRACTSQKVAVILAHGAGGDMNHKQLIDLATTLAIGGIACLRFTSRSLNLAYRSKVYKAVLVWQNMILQTFECEKLNRGFELGTDMYSSEKKERCLINYFYNNNFI